MSSEMVVSIITASILFLCVFFGFGGSGLIFRVLPYFRRVRRRVGEVDAKVVEFSHSVMTIKGVRLRCGAEVTFTHWFPDLIRDLESGIARTLGTAFMAQLVWSCFSLVIHRYGYFLVHPPDLRWVV